MNIVIIEDERLLAAELAQSVCELEPGAVISAQLHSVRESIAYLKSNDLPDLVFSDVQLGDGLSFEIFVAANIPVPIIFCTAYDEYALDAFRVSGIDYILKPFTQSTLKAALQKYKNLKRRFTSDANVEYEKLMSALSNQSAKPASSILVYYKDKIIPILLDEIAFFYVKNEETHLQTFSGKTYYPNKKLEELEARAGNSFFRANRQFLVNRKAIIDVSSFFSRKLSLNLNVPFPERITVSKEKAPAFLDWLAKAY